MKLPEKWYLVLKWVCMLCIPALATFYVDLSGVWGLPFADGVARTANALCTLIGALIGISTATYYMDDKRS